MKEQGRKIGAQRRPLATTGGEYLTNHGPRTYDHSDKVSDSEQKRKRGMQPYHDQEFYPHVEAPERKGRIDSRKNRRMAMKHLEVGIVGEFRLPFFEVWYEDTQDENASRYTNNPTTGGYQAIFRDTNGKNILEVSPENGIIVTTGTKTYSLGDVLVALENQGLI